MNVRKILDAVGVFAYRNATWGIVALSLALSIWHYANGRALWLDEAMVALNLKYMSWAEIFGKLSLDQFAPIGWLLAQKALLTLTGSYEYGLRALSLLAWVGSLLIFRRLLMASCSHLGAIIGLALFAFSAPLVRYAVEVKPYELDVFVAVAVLALGHELVNGVGDRRKTWIVLSALGVFAVLFTFGGVLALGPGVLAVIVRMARTRRWVDSLKLILMSAVWLAGFAALIVALYLPQMQGSALTEGGADAFFTRTSYAPLPSSFGEVIWYGDWAHSALKFAFHEAGWVAAAIVLALGVIRLGMAGPEALIAAVGPVLVGLVASSAHAYPMFDRLMLFCLPGLLLAIVVAIDWLIESPIPGRLAAVALAVSIAGGPVLWLAGQAHARPAFARHEVRPALRELAAKIQPGDEIYVTNMTIPSYLQYREQAGLADRSWIEGRTSKENWACMLAETPDLQPGKSIWVLRIYNDAALQPGDDLATALALYGLSGKAELVMDMDTTELVRIDLLAGDEMAAPMRPQLSCGAGRLGNRFDVPREWRPRLGLDPRPEPGSYRTAG